MKFKYYLRGLGIGIIFTTILFMIAIAVNKDKLFTEKEIIQKAEALGMVMKDTESFFDVETETSTQAETDGETAKDTEENTKGDSLATNDTDTLQTTGKTNTDNAGDANAAGNSEASESASAAENENNVQSSAVQYVEITVNKGDTCAAVAERLLEAGLISDSVSFVNYLSEHGLVEELEIATFQIPQGSDMATIAQILTTSEYEIRMQQQAQ